MITILHWINLDRLYRCHLSFNDDQNVINYYLIEKLPKIEVSWPKNRVFLGCPRELKFLRSVLSSVKPDVVICANLIDDQYMQLMRDRCQYFVYLNHSVWSPATIQLKRSEIKKNPGLVQQYSIFDQLYLLPHEAQMWQELGLSKEKIVVVNGLTFLDLILLEDHTANRAKMGISSDDQVILLIHNSSSSGCQWPNGKPKTNLENSHDYADLLEECIKYSVAAGRSVKIITKIGRRRDTLVETDRIQQLHSHDQVRVIWPEENVLMAKLLFADLILIQGYSTAYLEALLVISKVVSCYLKGKVFLDQEKYGTLPIITSRDQVISVLEKLLLDDSSNYSSAIKELMKESFGTEQIENVSSRIVRDLIEIFSFLC